MLSYVILHYQAIEVTKSSINSVVENTTDLCRIVIVDNASPNGTGKELSDFYKDNEKIKVILSGENLGFAKGNNLGFHEAKKDNPDFIIVMNNDVLLVQKDFSDRISQAFNEDDFDVLGPDIYSTKINGHQNPQRENNFSMNELLEFRSKTEFKIQHKWMLRIKYMFSGNKRNNADDRRFIKEKKMNVVLHGACYVFSQKFIKRHNNCFYPNTFMYFESYILHYLGSRENLVLVYDPKIQVLHHEDVATDQIYQSRYKKSVFVNKCLFDSCNVFIDVMNNLDREIG